MDRKRTISFEVRMLSHMIKREVDNSNNKKYVDSVTGTNGWIIGFLAENKDKDIFQRDLEEEFSVRRSTASRVLKLMEQKGFVSREPVSYDARLKKLVLTSKAWGIYKLISEDVEQMNNKLIMGLTDKEIDDFYKVLDKIKRNLT